MLASQSNKRLSSDQHLLSEASGYNKTDADPKNDILYSDSQSYEPAHAVIVLGQQLAGNVKYPHLPWDAQCTASLYLLSGAAKYSETNIA
jgi:hypothetical protein